MGEFTDCRLERFLHDLPSTENCAFWDNESNYCALNRPSAEPQRWNPITDRPPEVENNISKRVMVTTSWGVVKEAYYCIDHWEIGDIPYNLSAVIAWMSIPEPYNKKGY